MTWKLFACFPAHHFLISVTFFLLAGVTFTKQTITVRGTAFMAAFTVIFQTVSIL